MKVKELIEKLKKCNPEAELTVGDNFYNGISISYGYSDGCTEENCEYVCFDVDEKLCDNSERTTINLNGRSIQLESKTVKCKELQDYDYWREEDGTEVIKKIDNDESFSKTMEKYAKFAANDPEFFEYFLKLQRFQYDNCEACGTQRCLGVYDKDYREGCILYREEFDSEKDYTDIIDYAIQFLEWVKRDTDKDMWLKMIYDVYNTDNKVTLEKLVQEYFECNCSNPDQWDNAFKGVTKAVYYIGSNNLSDIENNINNF